MPRSSHPGYVDVQSSRRESIHVFQLSPGCTPEGLYRHVTGNWPPPEIVGTGEGGSISSSSTSDLMHEDYAEVNDPGAASDLAGDTSTSRKRRKIARKSKKSEIWFPRAEMAFCLCIAYIPPSGRTKIKFLGKSLGRNELIAVICSLATRRIYNRKQISSHSQVLKDKVPSPYKELLTFDDKVKLDEDGSGATIERYVLPEPICRMIGFFPNTDFSNARKPDWYIRLEAQGEPGSHQYVFPSEYNPNLNPGIQSKAPFSPFPQQPPPHQYPALAPTSQNHFPSPPPHTYPSYHEGIDPSYSAGPSHAITPASREAQSPAGSRTSIAAGALGIPSRRTNNASMSTSPTTSYHTGYSGTPTIEPAQPLFWSTNRDPPPRGGNLSGSMDSVMSTSSQGPTDIPHTPIQHVWRNNERNPLDHKTDTTHNATGSTGTSSGVNSDTWYPATTYANQMWYNMANSADSVKSDAYESGIPLHRIGGTGHMMPVNPFIPASLEISAKLPAMTGDANRNQPWILSSAQPLQSAGTVPYHHIKMWEARYPFLKAMSQSSVPAFHIEVPLRLPDSHQARYALFESSEPLHLRLVLRATYTDSPGYNLVTDSGFAHFKAPHRYPRQVVPLRRMYVLADQPIHVDARSSFKDLTALFRHMAELDMNSSMGTGTDTLNGIASPMSLITQMVVPETDRDGIEPPVPGSDWERAVMMVVYTLYVPKPGENAIPVCRQIDFSTEPDINDPNNSLLNQLLANERRKPSAMEWH